MIVGAGGDTDRDILQKSSQLYIGYGLRRRATQVVFGRGPRKAPIMLVGEQPGDQEDLAGEPFVGRNAGDPFLSRTLSRSRRRLLDQQLARRTFRLLAMQRQPPQSQL